MRRRSPFTWSRAAVLALGLWAGAGGIAIAIDIAESVEWRGPASLEAAP